MPDTKPSTHPHPFPHILHFCITEVARQEPAGDPLHTLNYLKAWAHCVQHIRTITPVAIATLGTLTEPDINIGGFRRVNHEGKKFPDFSTIQPNLIDLCLVQARLKPSEFFNEFLRIHPFIAGNHRVACILYNLLNNTLNHPVMP
jgi:hypothetical protein